MNAVDRLKAEHRHLMSQLATLDAALGMGPDAWFTVREVCFSVSKQLRRHLQREARVVEACRRQIGQIGSRDFELLVVDHHTARDRFLVANELLRGEPCCSLGGVRSILATTIAVLRRQMDDQGQRLFPFLSFMSRARGAFGRDEWLPSLWFPETMTVQQVLVQYPHAKAVFDQLHVNYDFERYETLAEVAWCHGLDRRRLLAQLGATVRGQRTSLSSDEGQRVVSSAISE